MARRRMIVVAGPPGSAKTKYFPVTAFGLDSFNIDGGRNRPGFHPDWNARPGVTC
jgi:hypothetical protein